MKAAVITRHPRLARRLAGSAKAAVIPGHEGIGHIEALGPGVTCRSVGDRVAIAWLGSDYGQCQHCVGGWETLPTRMRAGYFVDTDRWAEGEFFRATITKARFLGGGSY